MSLSRPTLKNPATRFMQWGGGAEAVGKDEAGKVIYEGGVVSYWDKEANEGEGANITVTLPLTFIVLDELSTVTGFNKATNSGFWSNEVRNLNKEDLVVRNKNGIVARGKYKDIADEIKAKGAKYTKSIYIAFYNDEKELVLGHLKLSGAAMSEWIEFQKHVDVSKAAVSMNVNPHVKTNGNIKYFVPSFDSMKISAATLENATKVDHELQSYLDVYFSRKPDEDEPITDDEVEIEETDIEVPTTPFDEKPAEKAEEPFESPKPAPKKEEAKKDESINLHDVEF